MNDIDIILEHVHKSIISFQQGDHDEAFKMLRYSWPYVVRLALFEYGRWGSIGFKELLEEAALIQDISLRPYVSPRYKKPRNIGIVYEYVKHVLTAFAHKAAGERQLAFLCTVASLLVGMAYDNCADGWDSPRMKWLARLSEAKEQPEKLAAIPPFVDRIATLEAALTQIAERGAKEEPNIYWSGEARHHNGVSLGWKEAGDIARKAMANNESDE